MRHMLPWRLINTFYIIYHTLLAEQRRGALAPPAPVHAPHQVMPRLGWWG